MGNFNVGLLILGLLVVSEIITVVTDSALHWPLVILGILVGLAAVRSIGG
jgi:hypothetical protein